MSTSLLDSGCLYCGSNTYHIGMCPRVKAIEYHPNGMIRRIELHDPYYEWNDDGEPVG